MCVLLSVRAQAVRGTVLNSAYPPDQAETRFWSRPLRKAGHLQSDQPHRAFPGSGSGCILARLSSTHLTAAGIPSAVFKGACIAAHR